MLSAALPMPTPLPTPWLDSDIGTVGLAGTAGQNADGSLAVTGGGADIWNSADAFHFAYQPLAGDGSVVTQVTAETKTNGWTKAGVMVRTSLAANSPEVSLLLTPSNGVTFQWRSATAGSSSNKTASATAGEWLEMIRVGTTLTAEISKSGTTWTTVGTATLPAGSAYVGLAITSHDNTQLATASFNQTAVTAAIVPTAPTAVAYTFGAAGDVRLTWQESYFSLSGYTLLRQGPGDAGFVPIANTTLPTYDDTAVAAGSGYQYEVIANDAVGSSTASTDLQLVTPAPLPPPPLPLSPTNLTLLSSSPYDAHLSWQEDPSSSVTTFTLLRAPAGSTNYAAVVSLSGSTIGYDDTSVVGGTSYSYEVIANNAAGSSAASAALVLSVAAPTPSSWSDLDIGAPGQAGGATATGSTLTVTGGGADIWNNADQFNFDYQSLVGNGSIVVQVSSQTNSNGWAKAGIMIRESLAAGARDVLLALTPSNGVTFQSRTATANNTVNSTASGKTGIWLELVRSGSTFIAYTSADGVTWKQVGTATVPMVNNVYVGLAVTAHDNTRQCTAAFSNVTISETGTAASNWSDGAIAPLSRWEAETFTWNNQLYVFGGCIDGNFDMTSECDVFDPLTNAWSVVTALPAGGLIHAAVTLVGDTVYFAGGDAGTQFTHAKTITATSEVLTFNLDTGTWGSTTPLPMAVADGGMVCINSTLYYFGGLNATETTDLSNTWALNLNNPTAGWTAQAAMPNARNHIGYAAINGIAYALGGQHLYKTTSNLVAEVDAYNPLSNTWTAVAPLPMALTTIDTSTLVINNKLVVIGGSTNGGYDGIYQNGIEEYDPTSNTWSNLGTIPEANEGLAAGYADGELILANGTIDNKGGIAQNQTWIDSMLQF